MTGMRGSSKHEWDEHLRLSPVAWVRGRKRGSQACFLHSRAVDEVDPDHARGDQQIQVDGHRRAYDREQQTRVDGVTHEAVGPGGHKLRLLLLGHRHPPVAAKVEPGPYGEAETGH